MNKKRKRLERMASNPQGDWTLEDVKVVCKGHGLVFRHDGGSHCTVSRPSQAEMGILTIPAHRPIKPIYIKKLVAFVGQIDGSEDDE